jgi:RNA polymerase sigma factor (sigma-70 family)
MALLDKNWSDSRILLEFATHRSEAAFNELTRRHLSLVFGTALRATEDRAAAEEIAQDVFVVLAKKAAWLQQEGSLAGWLYRATLLQTKEWRRSDWRRRQREEAAGVLETTMKTTEQPEAPLLAALDDALMELKEGERQAVLLRYLEGCNHREVGAALGIGEDAARKRVDKAMEHLAAFFRKRGLAVGSTAALAALLTGASQAAPAWLSGSIAKAALAAPGASPWLLKLLGLEQWQAAGLSLALFLAPILWQQTRLISARAEQRRLTTLLAVQQSDDHNLQVALTTAHRELERLSNHLARAQTQSQPLTQPGNANRPANPQLLLWDENAEFVRVPKSVLKRVRFDGSKAFPEMHAPGEKTLSQDGKVSATAMDVLGLTEAQRSQVQALLNAQLQGYQTWADASRQVLDFPTAEASVTNLPPGLKRNTDSRVWLTPDASEGSRKWQEQFSRELGALIGQDRAAALLAMARNDDSLSESLHRFAANGEFLLITPNADGGLYVSQLRVSNRGSGGGTFNTPVSFSDILSPEQPFDEAAAREQIEERIRQAQAQGLTNDIPPMAMLVQSARRIWQNQHSNILRENNTHLPPEAVDYVRQWRDAHPEVPDAIPAQNLPQHP